MSLPSASSPMMFMLRQFLKQSPIKEQIVPDEKISEEFAALSQRLANANMELRRIVEPNSGFIAYYVAPKGGVGLAGITK